MLNEREPDPLSASIFDVCLRLHAEHTMNASTFSARVTASTLTDPYAVVASAVEHSEDHSTVGANEEVIGMLSEMVVENVPTLQQGSPPIKPKSWALVIVSTSQRSAGDNPQDLAQSCSKFGHDKYYDIAVEDGRKRKLAQKGIYPNIDFYSGLVYRKLGIPLDLFTPVFAIARHAGWLAHWKEQLTRKPHLPSRPSLQQSSQRSLTSQSNNASRPCLILCRTPDNDYKAV